MELCWLRSQDTAGWCSAALVGCGIFPPTSFCFLGRVFPCWAGPHHVLLAKFTGLLILQEASCSLLSQ